MTTPKLSSEKIFDFSFFKNLMRRRAVHVLLAFLVNFFTISVPIMMAYGNYDELFEQFGTENMINRAVNDMKGIMVLNLVFTLFFAVYLGIITLGYMMKRRSAHFYHALPQRRETLYVTSIASALLCAAIGAVANLIIAIIELVAFKVVFAEVVAVMATSLYKNLILFLAIYAVTVFAGTVSGSGVVQFLMTLVITLYPLATYFGVFAMREAFSDYFYPEFYFNAGVVQWLSPFAYAVLNYEGDIRVIPTVISILVTVALLFGGLLIYKKRAIENSERPIVFKKLGTVLKYMLMFTVTVFAGMFFLAIGYSLFHIIFGFVCGAVLSFMLFNTILEKSPKAMFQKPKGLLIFIAAFTVYALFWCFDVVNFDDYVPSENNILHAEIEVGNAGYENKNFDDKEIISALSVLLKNQNENNKKGIISPVSGGDARFRVNVVMYTKLGIPIARTYNISKFTDGAQEFLKLYADDPRMNEAYEKEIKGYIDAINKGYTADFSINFNGYHSVEGKLDEFFSVYVSEFGKANYDRLSMPSVGGVSIYSIYNVNGDRYDRYEPYRGNTYSLFNELPIYEDMKATIAYIESLKVIDNSTGEYVDRTDVVKDEEFVPTRGYVFDTRKGATCGEVNCEYVHDENLRWYPSKEISAEFAKELYEMLCPYYNSRTTLSRVFMAIDTDYVLAISFGGVDEEIQEKYGYTESTDCYGYDNTYLFPKGYVPDEINAMF